MLTAFAVFSACSPVAQTANDGAICDGTAEERRAHADALYTYGAPLPVQQTGGRLLSGLAAARK